MARIRWSAGAGARNIPVGLALLKHMPAITLDPGQYFAGIYTPCYGRGS